MDNFELLGKSQGSDYLNKKKYILSDVGRQSLIVESFNESTNLLEDKESSSESNESLAKKELDTLEDKFQTLLSQYSILSKTVYQNKVNHTNNKDSEQHNEEEKELAMVNKQMLDIANTIYNKLQNTEKTINAIKDKKHGGSMYFDNQVNRFKNLLDKYNELNENEETLNGILEDARLIEGANNINFVLYGISIMILAIIAYRTFR